jgi:hypothetical protein
MADDDPPVAKVPEFARSGVGDRADRSHKKGEARKPGKTPGALEGSPAPADGADLDDDLDDYDIGPAYDEMTLPIRLAYYLFLLSIPLLIGYLILVIMFPDEFAPRDWVGEARPEKEGTIQLTGFQLGGIYLGSTPDEARQVYPSLRLEANPNAGVTDQIAQYGYFAHHGGEYRISFLGPKRGSRAFKVRSAHAYSKVSYLELLSELSGRYGKPGEADCQASEKTIGIQCALYWRMANALVNAQIKTTAPKGDGEAMTTLVVTAKDTRPDHFFASKTLAGFDPPEITAPAMS